MLSHVGLRPRARYRMQWDQLAIGQTVMVNYNPDHPRLRGYWYDGTITRKVSLVGVFKRDICIKKTPGV